MNTRGQGLIPALFVLGGMFGDWSREGEGVVYIEKCN